MQIATVHWESLPRREREKAVEKEYWQARRRRWAGSMGAARAEDEGVCV